MNQPFYVLMHISNRLSKDKKRILPHKLRSNSWEQKHAIDSQGFNEIENMINAHVLENSMRHCFTRWSVCALIAKYFPVYSSSDG